MGDPAKIIRFPGPSLSPRHDEVPAWRPGPEDRVSENGSGILGISGLSADQEKAIQIILSGMDFVLVGIKPTGGGADFFTAVHGQRRHLSEAAPHLDGVVRRALVKKGIEA